MKETIEGCLACLGVAFVVLTALGFLMALVANLPE